MTHPDDNAKIQERLTVDCFNSAWDLIDKSDRSLAGDEEMLLDDLATLP